MLQRTIPSSGGMLPVIGLGTWQTFDVPFATPEKYPGLHSVLSAFSTQDGAMIDSSPMYGHAEDAVGALAAALPGKDRLFYATKVWTTGRDAGIRQMEHSLSAMQRPTIDLIQIHNLVDWETHYKTLQDWKGTGKVRYTGITHYTDDAHEALEKLLATVSLDFVQFNYSLFNRHAEVRLLDAAAASGVATIINRPFGEGRLFARVKDKPLPAWAGDYDITDWSTFLLKYIISHPAVTCVIPATADPAHAAANILAGNGPLPDAAARARMVKWIERF